MSLGFHALWGAALFSLAVPVVVFYFLKLRRPRLDVPSLVLWRKVLQDARVNSPFRRFKRNILLFLQLAALSLVALAAMQPFWRGTEARRRRTPVLVDCSASMAARDGAGLSRLDAAKEEVRKVIDGMAPGDELCLVSFGRAARRRTGFTDNSRILAGALRELEVEDAPGDISGALRLADALSRTASFDEVLIISDGNVPEELALELSFDVDLRRLPPAGANVGVTSLGARRAPGGDWDVFAMVEGSVGARTRATVEVLEGGDVIASEALAFDPGDEPKGRAQGERIAVRVPGASPSSLTVRLVPEGPDSLDSDNVAYLDLPAARRLGVFAPEEMSAFAHGLAAIEGVAVSGDAADRAGLHDLVVSDREADLALEGRTRLFVGLVPGDLSELVRVDEQGTEVVDWRRDHPLLAHVGLADVVILDRPASADGVREADLERLGYEVIATGATGPLVLERAEGDRLTFYMLFHADRSTLPYRVGFPVLLKNLVDVAMRRSGLAEVQATRTGVLPPIRVAPEAVCEIDGPSGRREERSGPGGLLSGVAAPRVGRYSVACGGTVRPVGASLLSPRETSLETVDGIRFREVAVAASSGSLRADRPFWYPVALCAFALLLFEWWFYQRRPGGWP